MSELGFYQGFRGWFLAFGWLLRVLLIAAICFMAVGWFFVPMFLGFLAAVEVLSRVPDWWLTWRIKRELRRRHEDS